MGRRDKYLQAALFAMVGVLNTVLDFAVFLALTRLWFVNPIIANAAGFITGSLHSYFANGLLTFRGSGARLLSVRPALSFVASLLICLGVSTITVAALLPLISDVFAKVAATLATFVVGFVISRRVVFVRQPIDRGR